MAEILYIKILQRKTQMAHYDPRDPKRNKSNTENTQLELVLIKCMFGVSWRFIVRAPIEVFALNVLSPLQVNHRYIERRSL